MLVQDLGMLGTRVIVQKCNISSWGDVQVMVETLASQGLAPIAGVVNGAKVLQVCRSAPPLHTHFHSDTRCFIQNLYDGRL